VSVQFNTIFTHLSDAVLVIDPYEDSIVESNSEAQNQLGYTALELQELSASLLFLPTITEMISFTQAVLHEGYCWNNDLQIQTKHDESIRMDISARMMLAKSDKPLMIFTLRNFEELAKQHRLTEANSLQREGLLGWKSIESVFNEFESQNHLILNAVGEGIYGVDTEGNTTFVNPAAERILGWKRNDLIGKNIHKMIHHSHADGDLYPAHKCHIFAAFRDGEVRHVDNEVFWRKDKKSIAVEYTSTPIMEGQRPIGAVVVFRDISERKMADEKLRAALDEVQALKQKLELENAYLQEEYLSEHNYKEIIGRSVVVNKLIHQIELVAPTNAAVLVTGESGTGKELIARAIHDNSSRHDRPMIRVNCATIPRELFESEFFGHLKGAFTGAMSDRAGRFELADGGTLFLDEISEIPLALQSKLLRVLQEQQYERVGESITRRVDVRIIAASNRDLKKEVEEKNFREDLYFRLNVFPIESMPLRKRLEDIPFLAAHFLEKASQKFGKSKVQLTKGDVEYMQRYHWPGNIRELINVIERAVILSQDGRLNLELIISEQGSTKLETPKLENKDIYTEDDIRQHQYDNIVIALKACNGKVFGKGGAAEILDVKPTTLTSRIKKLGINRNKFVSV